MLKWFTFVLNKHLSPTSFLEQNESAIFEQCSLEHWASIFPEFHQYQTGALKCLAKEHSNEKPRGSSVARTRDLKVTNHTL